MFKDLIGIPFKYGESDCEILFREVFKRYGIIIPDYSISREVVGKIYNAENIDSEIKLNTTTDSWLEINSPKEPCAIVMSLGSPGFYHHVGVYIGGNKFIHNSRLRGCVTIEQITNPLFRNRKYYDFINSH